MEIGVVGWTNDNDECPAGMLSKSSRVAVDVWKEECCRRERNRVEADFNRDRMLEV